MKNNFSLLLLLFIPHISSLSFAQPDCLDWTTDPQDFFRQAEPEEVYRCLNAGVDIDATYDFGMTALHYAASTSRSIDIIDVLLDAGADVTVTDDVGRIALHYAVLNDHPPMTARLIEVGADVNALDVFGYSILRSAVSVARPPRVTDTAIIEMLINAGADVNSIAEDGSTPLHEAAMNNDILEFTTKLLDAGANVNAVSEVGWTPLHYAARFSRNPAILEALLDAGADPDARANDGQTVHQLAQDNEELRDSEVLRQLEGSRDPLT